MFITPFESSGSSSESDDDSDLSRSVSAASFYSLLSKSLVGFVELKNSIF